MPVSGFISQWPASADFTATVIWGDGTMGAGTVVSTGSGNYRVDAKAHTYTEENPTVGYSVTVTVKHDGLATLTSVGHLYLLPQKGIYIMENLNLEELASDRCYEFAFIGIPLKFNGATGSPLRPLALADGRAGAEE